MAGCKREIHIGQDRVNSSEGVLCIQREEKLIAEDLRMMLEISGYIQARRGFKPITKRFLQLSSCRYDWSCTGPLAGVKDM
jgi:hypothetical protein